MDIVHFLVSTVGQMGYFGIVALMFLESSFFPFPSEVIMIPAGYLAFQGEMNLALAVACGILGSLLGAWFNYFMAVKFGRSVLLKIVSSQKMERLEAFFDKHGHISTFSGRLIPGVRQYISLPAGLAKMDAVTFSLYTALGAGLWVGILTFLGYYIGSNQALIHAYLKEITIVVLCALSVIAAVYVALNRRGTKKSAC
jgi:membrane protein DedA with SNARE-associated domain